MKTMELCGEVFEVHKARMYSVAPITGCNKAEIFEVYGKPSSTKVSIWNYWCNWCIKMNESGYECGIQIYGHNSSFFTINGSLRHKDEVMDFWITASHNRLYLHN